jgi:hypothetical protein
MADTPEETEAASYADIQGEVNKHFAGNWKKFLLAVNNPAEILHFVFANYCKRDKGAFEAWGKQQGVPEDWIPRFFMTLDEGDDLKPKDKW